jgi:hypothetical protein
MNGSAQKAHWSSKVALTLNISVLPSLHCTRFSLSWQLHGSFFPCDTWRVHCTQSGATMQLLLPEQHFNGIANDYLSMKALTSRLSTPGCAPGRMRVTLA